MRRVLAALASSVALAVAGPVAAQTMDHGRMQGGPPPADARDPDAYADGLAPHAMPGMDMADDARHGALLVDHLEAVRGRGGSHGQSIDAQAWYGGDRDKLRGKVDGDRRDGRLAATLLEALWDRAIAPYWSGQVGVRYDVGDGPARSWAAVGIQGLAPWWFDVELTGYVGSDGRTALRFESEYDLRILQKLVLRPRVKLDAYGKDDRARDVGAGLSRVEAGLRLRYDATRRVAPHVGVVLERALGNTARLVRASGERAIDVQVVAGVQLNF